MARGKFEKKPEPKRGLFHKQEPAPVRPAEQKSRVRTRTAEEGDFTLSLDAEPIPQKTVAPQVPKRDGLSLSFEAKPREPKPERPAAPQSPELEGLSLSFEEKPREPKPVKPAVPQSPELEGLSLPFETKPKAPAAPKPMTPKPERTAVPQTAETADWNLPLEPEINESPRISHVEAPEPPKQPQPERTAPQSVEEAPVQPPIQTKPKPMKPPVSEKVKTKVPKPEPETPKKRNPFLMVLNAIKNLFVWAITLLAVGMMIFTVVSVTTLDRNDRTLLGYRAFIVLSDSMKATDFDAGDVVLVKQVDPDTLQPGDIIAYTSQNSSNYGQTVTHKIRERTTDSNGNPAFITYGTTTDIDDETPVPYSHILGKYQRALPKVGYFFQFLRTGPGYILFILIPFGLLILYQALQSVHLFRKTKKEEMAKLEAERAQIQAEREETRQMLAELRKLQAQLGANQQGET